MTKIEIKIVFSMETGLAHAKLAQSYLKNGGYVKLFFFCSILAITAPVLVITAMLHVRLE